MSLNSSQTQITMLWQSALEELTIPAMVVWGKKDSGHYLQEDRPEDLPRLIHEFVNLR
jgi:hypothetical protein